LRCRKACQIAVQELCVADAECSGLGQSQS